MLTSFVEVYEENRSFYFREILVNLDHVNFVREDPQMRSKIAESNSQLDERGRITRLFINRGNMGYELAVVGTIEEIYKKFNKTSKTLLRD